MENSLKRNYYEESEDSYETIDVQRKRKRNVLTLEQKLEVIYARENGELSDTIAKRYNIGASTVSDIYKRRLEIESMVERNKNLGITNKKTLKDGTRPLLEHALYNWYTEQEALGATLLNSGIIEKAKEISAEMHDDNAWEPTTIWLRKFKDRYGLKEETSKDNYQSETETLSFDSALNAAEYLLNFMNARDNFPLKDVITVRMIRDRIVSESLEADPL